MIDRDYLASTLAKIDSSLIEDLSPALAEHATKWAELIDTIKLAQSYRDELQLEFDSELWGYSLLSVLQSCGDSELVPLSLMQPTIEVIQELLVDDSDAIESLKEIIT